MYLCSGVDRLCVSKFICRGGVHRLSCDWHGSNNIPSGCHEEASSIPEVSCILEASCIQEASSIIAEGSSKVEEACLLVEAPPQWLQQMQICGWLHSELLEIKRRYAKEVRGAWFS